ncbi:hypothetical protein [Methylorubrum extorquens]|uniref:hypothetical protein n=1 Tax=Methylorubrum extorquens TaxID=408 RepID=UPI0005C14033|nr:hypothetical protein [Methylorubrum extorquens]MCP1545767.1 hypothetical protein [Methylorubrum extorquens]MCP1591718.1 hypothetical protein [Methylorubrum extorquens]
MFIVESIAKVLRLFRERRSIREISRELRLSRKVVRKALRSDKTAFAYPWRRPCSSLAIGPVQNTGQVKGVCWVTGIARL